jgi:hypothetical protein
MTCLTGLEIPHNGILAYLIKVSIYLVSDHWTCWPIGTFAAHFVKLVPPVSAYLLWSQPPLSNDMIILGKSFLQVSAWHDHNLPVHSELMQDPVSPTTRLPQMSHLLSLSTPWYTQLTTFPEQWDNYSIESPPPGHLPSDLPPFRSPPAFIQLLLIEYYIQSALHHILDHVYRYTTKVAWDWSQSISLSSLYYALYVNLTMCVSVAVMYNWSVRRFEWESGVRYSHDPIA